MHAVQVSVRSVLWAVVLTALIAGLLRPAVVGAVHGPVGSEFQVNTYTTSGQQYPAVAADGAGNFVVVWQSFGQDGSRYGVFGQRYDSTGLPVGSEFQVNTYTTGYQEFPAVASDAAGNFVVVWESAPAQGNGQVGSGTGIFGQRYNSSGTPQGPEFHVNSYPTGDQFIHAVVADAGGNFVVVWVNRDQDGSRDGVYAQRYDSMGLPVGSEFQVNTYTTGDQWSPAVAADGAGNFVVVWQSFEQDGSRYGVFGQRYDSTGLPVGSEFQVNTYTTGYQAFPAVASDAAGNFVVVWESGPVFEPGQDGSGSGIFGQRYNSSGTPQGPEFQVNSYTTGSQFYPRVATDAGGNFVVVWNFLDGSDFGVFAQRYDSTGLPVGSEFQVNTFTPQSQIFPAVAADGAGNFVMVWESFGQDGEFGGIFGQRYDTTGAPFPGRVPVSGASLTLADKGATTRRLTLRSGDPSVANGINPVINPVANGAFLHIFNNAGSGESACFPLPPTGWAAVAPDKFIYSDPAFVNGPCYKALIKRGRFFRANCRSSVQPISYSLDEAMQGSVGVNLTIGPATYCALFGGIIAADSGALGQFRARKAPPPTSCPTPPASCP